MLLVRVGPQRPPTLPAGSSGISLRIPPQFRYYPAIGKARGMPARTRFLAALRAPLDANKPAEKMELTGDSGFSFYRQGMWICLMPANPRRAGLTLRRRTCPGGQERGGMSN